MAANNTVKCTLKHHFFLCATRLRQGGKVINFGFMFRIHIHPKPSIFPHILNHLYFPTS